MLVPDNTTGTGENPTFVPFGGEGERSVILIALSLNEQNKTLVSGYADTLESDARGYLQERGYDVGSARFKHVLDPKGDPNAIAGFTAKVYHEAASEETNLEEPAPEETTPEE